MKKLSLVIAALGLVVSSLFGSSISALDANNFTINSFTADYYLSKDDEGRSRMTVREEVVAEFPSIDQNHGILRAIPERYDGHSVSLEVKSVTKQDGAAWAYSTSSSSGNLVLRIGDADIFVHGKQTYIIEYELRDVTKAFKTGDELFWDVNGTEWSQPFDTVTARVHVPAELTEQLRGEMRCFAGGESSTNEECSGQVTRTDNETLYTFTASGLARGENLSFVVGFEAETFQPYRQSPLVAFLIKMLIVVIPILYIFLPIFLLVRSVRYWRRYGRDPKGRGTIIPEYVVPPELSVIDSTVILHDRMPVAATSATLIDLAVRHYIKLYEVGEGGFFKLKEYEIELIKAGTDLREEEQAVLAMLFGADATVGARVKLKDLSEKLYKKVTKIDKQAQARVVKNGYMIDSKKQEKKMTIWGIVLLVVGMFSFNPLLVIAGFVTLFLGYVMPARTDKGVIQRDYLYGLRDYMKLAEAERLKVLQSPEGASAGSVNPGDNAQLVKLYEKLLPYAMVFGIEKEWIKQFADLYTQPPDWYGGNWTTFNAAVFASSLSGLSTTATSSFAPPSSSSSSGFSGGGSSGGGGGGGGGGGW